MASGKWDAVVIGAGPAGASVSRTLIAGGMKCLLIEKKKLPRDKMCSGILSNWAVDFVHRRFGAMPEGVYCRPNFIDGAALHFPSIDEPVIIDSCNPIPNIWRSHFDNFLAEKSGAVIREGYTLQHIEKHPAGFSVTCKFSKGGRAVTESFYAKYIMGADGANSRSLSLMMPEAVKDLAYGVGMQMHYTGEINLDPKRYHVFFYPGMGFYAWASFKDDDIHVGSGIMGKKGLNECLENFISLLKTKYAFKIKKTVRIEGMAGALKGPFGIFIIGKGNYITAGDAGGFVHNFGEGISCALTTGDLAGSAILTAEETGADACDIYRLIVRDEAELCLDQFNPLRMLKKTLMPMDFGTFRKRYSMKDMLSMLNDVRKYFKYNNKGGGAGIGKAMRKNMVYHMFRGKYPVEL
jgi:flavin-dependent dehydrogenase